MATRESRSRTGTTGAVLALALACLTVGAGPGAAAGSRPGTPPPDPRDAVATAPAAEPEAVPEPVPAAAHDAVVATSVGSLDEVRLDGTLVTVRGWAVDSSRPEGPVEVRIVSDGVQHVTSTGQPRPDVAAAHPGYGPSTGFVATLHLPPGARTLCALAFPLAPRPHVLGCQVVSVPTSPPVGALDEVTSRQGFVEVRGWVLHEAVTTAIAAHVYVDGTWAASVVADDDRPDVAAVHPEAGPGHGFAASVPVTEGEHTVCVYGISLYGDQASPLLGCQQVRAPSSAPVGHLETVAASGARARLVGWGVDPPATAQPIDVHVYRDGQWAGSVLAAEHRPDVAAAYGLAGAAHGFALDLDLPVGRHTFCVYAINAGAGSTNPELGCVPVGVPVGDPFGSLDGAVRTDPVESRTGVDVHGWAIDPDTREPVDVHVYLDGRYVTAVRASGVRADVGAVYPTLGAAHGYASRISVASGPHTVCVYAINQGMGTTNPLLGCVAVP